jgi:Acetyltransferase (GNAT) family
MLSDAARNHLSWFARGRELVELDAVRVFLGDGDAVLAFPEADGDLADAVRLARESGAREISCWALLPDVDLGERLSALGLQDGWQPHWMGVDPTSQREEPAHAVEETTTCSRVLDYWSGRHESVLGGDVHHFVVRSDDTIVGHAVLNVAGETGGIYDMAVARSFRRRGYGRR